MNRVPINTDRGGYARCIKAGYYKMGWTNFMRGLENRKERNLEKSYRRIQLLEGGRIVPTLLATDYKSPHLVIEYEDISAPSRVE